MEPWKEKFAETMFARAADTAHDLKTPLNIAVLNLELLRMRVRKIMSTEDPKVAEYAKALDAELRRLAAIFDAFFVNSVPPRGETAPGSTDAAPILCEAAAQLALQVNVTGPLQTIAHPSRIQTLATLFFRGASRLLEPSTLNVCASSGDGLCTIRVSGRPVAEDLELGKLFKFYYTDASGVPDLSLATSRLIAETYGGSLSVAREDDRVALELFLPQGEK